MPAANTLPKIVLRNARAWAPRTPVKWAAVVIAFLAALILRLALQEHLGPRYPLVFFTMVTLVVHFFYGLLPALVLAFMSLPTGLYLFVPPYVSFSLPDGDDLLRVVNYIVVTAVFMVLIQYLRRAQYQSALLYEIAESRYLMLLDSEADRNAIEGETHSREA
jgi:K+-sensing histidine kinase KdpD